MTKTAPPKRLDPTQKQQVVYAIPTWLRDEQVRVNTANVKGRIAPSYERRTEPVAIACFGPSLRQTWEQIREFRYVISCSGSHRFLIDRGIIPTWHVEVDPRQHKIALLGAPHPDVEYLVASTCHPDYFAHLKDATVKLWHVFDSQEEGMRVLPPKEFAITGGCDVGSRAMTIAAFLGFRDLHVFGMDGCEDVQGKHADAHPMEPVGYSLTTYDGVEYKTTPALLEAARNIWHELDQMPVVRATFYGEGLVQHMARHYQPKPATEDNQQRFVNIIAFDKPELISAEYRALNRQLHDSNLAYGVGGGRHAPVVHQLANKLQTQSILDYGCGKGYLAKALPFPIWEYDPAIPGKEGAPRAADLVVCADVLEHIEPAKLPAVLQDLRRCTRKVGYFVIHTGPAGKHLADGRNAHLIQKPLAWWRRRLEQFFLVASIEQRGPELYVVVGVPPAQARKAQAA